LPFERSVPTYATLDPTLQARSTSPDSVAVAETDPITDTIPLTDPDLVVSEGGSTETIHPTSHPTTSLPSQSPTSHLFPTPVLSPAQFAPTQPPIDPVQLFVSEGVGSPAPSNGQPSDAPSAFFVHYLQSIAGSDHEKWEDSMHTEILRLVLKTKSMTLIPSNIVPEGARVGHANPITKTKYSPTDASQPIEWRTRLSWNESAFADAIARITASTTADTTLVKLLINSAISDPNAELSTIDVDDFYLNTLLKYLAFLCALRHVYPRHTQKKCSHYLPLI
jgi:hypothetical protein